MSKLIISEVKKLELGDGVYDFEGFLPDSREVLASVVIRNSQQVIDDCDSYYGCDVDVELLVDGVELTESEVEFWEFIEASRTKVWIEKLIDMGNCHVD